MSSQVDFDHTPTDYGCKLASFGAKSEFCEILSFCVKDMSIILNLCIRRSLGLIIFRTISHHHNFHIGTDHLLTTLAYPP